MSIILDKVNYIYGEGTGFVRHALKDISLVISKNEFIGLIGHTGSGKSTLTQILNGLIRASSGNVFYDEQDIYDKGYNIKELRRKVGLVFQYPEHQLFEATVFKDVCFGPKNLGLSQRDSELRAFEALEMVGMDKDLFYNSPFELILDEPTAGLDPKGRDEILGMVKGLHEKTGNTVILVSHSMEDVARYVDRILVMNDGELLYDDSPKEVFAHSEELERIGLAVPEVTKVMNLLRQKGFDADTSAITIDEGFESILRIFKER